MLGMDGAEFIINFKELAQSQPKLKKVPFFIMISENFSSASFNTTFASNNNFQGFIEKTGNPIEIMEFIQKTLKNYKYYETKNSNTFKSVK